MNQAQINLFTILTSERGFLMLQWKTMDKEKFQWKPLANASGFYLVAFSDEKEEVSFEQDRFDDGVGFLRSVLPVHG